MRFALDGLVELQRVSPESLVSERVEPERLPTLANRLVRVQGQRGIIPCLGRRVARFVDGGEKHRRGHREDGNERGAKLAHDHLLSRAVTGKGRLSAQPHR